MTQKVSIYLSTEASLMLEAIEEANEDEGFSRSAIVSEAVIEYGERVGFEVEPATPARVVRTRDKYTPAGPK